MTPQPLSRGIDYLKDLGIKVRDLQGAPALARELLQNAHDAGADEVEFRVTAEALTVENDRPFSRCSDVTTPSCEQASSDGHGACDFHRFRTVAGEGKRDVSGTIGAFGIGFSAVYQVTDRPSILSAGEHWTLHEEHPEQERIIRCGGCPQCEEIEARGVTRFELPWARDANSRIRRGMSVQAVAADVHTTFGRELRDALSHDLLFLSRPRRIRVLDAAGEWSLEKSSTGSVVTIRSTTSPDEEWLILRGNFQLEGLALRERSSGQIEQKRSSEVSLAIRRQGTVTGRLYAFLPTEERTGLPFHLTADFLIESSRKHVDLVSSGVRTQWNLAALSSCATTLVEHLEPIRRFLSPTDFWNVLGALKHLAAQPGATPWQRAFWAKIRERADGADWFWSESGRWCEADDVYQVEDPEGLPHDTLAKLGIEVIHESLRPHFSLISELGVSLLDRAALAEVIRDAGLSRRMAAAELPCGLEPDDLARLRALLHSVRERGAADLASLALARGCDGHLWPLGQLRRATSPEVSLFSPVAGFLLSSDAEVAPLVGQVRALDCARAVSALEHVGPASLHSLIAERKLKPAEILGWFEGRVAELSGDLARRLSALPLFATADGYRPLAELSLPSGFQDLVGIAEVVDVRSCGVGADFLSRLGASPLSLGTYVRIHVVRVFREPARFERRARVLLQLAEQIGLLMQDPDLQELLAAEACIPCQDGELRPPDEVYLGSAELRVLLPGAHLADVTASAGLRELFSWLGVETEPRPVDVIRQIERLIQLPPTDDSVQTIDALFREMARRAETFAIHVEDLDEEAWLPAVGDRTRWHHANELHAAFNKDLFASAAIFVDLPLSTQRSCAEFLRSCGVEAAPATRLIVKHLLNLSREGQPPPTNIYRELQNRLGEPATTKDLRPLFDQPSIYADGRYYKPQQVFWGDHPFGPRRLRLSPELRTMQPLFTVLGVREGPQAEDARVVLEEIAAGYAPTNAKVSPEDAAVISASFALLATPDLVEAEAALSRLSARRVFPDSQGYLCEPRQLFIADTPRLSDRFPRLARYIVPRVEKEHVALERAGARPLSAAAVPVLLEAENPEEDVELARSLEDLRNPLVRVLDAEGLALPASWPVPVIRVDRLLVQWSIRTARSSVDSTPQEVAAVFVTEEGTRMLYVRRDGGGVGSIAFARELALLLAPGREPGGLALALKEVLSAGSAMKAMSSLDELGYQSLNAQVEAPSALAVSAVGVEGAPPAELSGSLGEARSEPEDDDRLADGGDGEREERGGTSVSAGPGPGASAEARGPGNGARERDQREPGAGWGKTCAPSASTQPRTRRRKDRLLSYVLGSDPQETTDDAGDDAIEGKRTAVEEAAVVHVVSAEQEAGRVVEVMPPRHPGYDIESRDAEGNLARIIEVKGIDGPWGPAGVGLSPRQFEEGQQRRDQFWLYVVEHAQSEHHRIHRIQDPVTKITKFQFDDGWRGAADVVPDALE